jgi:hypothetical protein
LLSSQARVDHFVDLAPERFGIYCGEMTPALEERLGAQSWPRQCTKFSHALAVTRDRDQFTTSRAVDNLTAFVSQVSDADFIHATKVYHA